MNTSAGDRIFSGSIPQFYQRYMVPLIFQSYAADLARRTAALRPSSVLELAAGTGAVTRQLADQLPAASSITATDLNPAMLQQAGNLGASRPITWSQADAMRLPFEDQSFDAVVCQFGYMFLADKAAGYAEARRVLRPGGALLFNVWDRIEDNAFAATVEQALARLFPDDPPKFMSRVPHGYHDLALIAGDLARGGFTGQQAIETVAFESRADTPRTAAIAYCQGTPLRNEIEARDASMLDKAVEMATDALRQRYGTGPITGKIQAHVVTAPRDA
ncbi:2-methoxy-6-polyprenyl-1,4-benzoquinol methylase, mitochondrial [Achromobacter anxifer]|uniref:2-methoxy-6-polyprenyl-1,4-benzoquinol methylase, mitochondrial n=1 Tax=Achromobacter anxifer TaxID=1287737 RepID=A0A6S7EYW7_9BURK|nr:class I SAM-dependent methyltransferase [Achromobacter anxifer]CAB3923008.1 2-methoxy-6-polyprenyl-1,4-benzoquinol methylase, mitochondrial [Achromobacter anxifer]CAB5517144.1 2-methoxy-6-polyprenyl-1,4-benzoquinol methylase, mitochondrial [Achromobacter anxifer]